MDGTLHFFVKISGFCIIIHSIIVEPRLTNGLIDDLDQDGRRIADKDLVQEVTGIPFSLSESRSKRTETP